MPDSTDVLIIGAGPAGVACATELRAAGFDGSVLLAGRELDPPYERPPLSKAYLLGRVDRSALELELPGDVDLRVRTSVMKLDTEARVAKLATGEELGFGKALLATGANVRRLRVDGAQLEGIHYLRALGNADAIRTDAEAAERVVLIGGSYIACEVAASLTSIGKRCTLVMLEDTPLSTGFGSQVGAWVAGLLQSHGVELVTGDPLAGFAGEERVQRVLTESGREIECDMVVMGTGAVPDVMLARAAGLELSEGAGGVACSASLRTSAPDVWAAGDICAYESVLHGGETRVEHWEVAKAQGRHVGRAMVTGEDAPFSEVPYFWSDLADWASVEYVSAGGEWDHEEVHGSFESGEFAVTYSRDGQIVACLSAGRAGELNEARSAIAERASKT